MQLYNSLKSRTFSTLFINEVRYCGVILMYNYPDGNYYNVSDRFVFLSVQETHEPIFMEKGRFVGEE